MSASPSFTPRLAAPVYLSNSATPAHVAESSDGNGRPDIALSATSGTGSTGSVTYTENGWTNAPYDQVLGGYANQACTSGSSFSTYASSSSQANGSSGPVITASVVGSPTTGARPLSDQRRVDRKLVRRFCLARYLLHRFGLHHQRSPTPAVVAAYAR